MSATRFDPILLVLCVLVALAIRLPGLTVYITADEARSWFGRSLIFADSLNRGDWANTAPGGRADFIENVSLSPAPGVTTMWAGTLGITLQQWVEGAVPLSEIPFDPLDPAMLFWLRLPGVIFAALGAGLAYWWSRPMLGAMGAFLAGMFIALDPFYLNLSRVLGHDALVSGSMALALIAFLRAMDAHTERRWPFLVASAMFGGLAFVSKYPALFIGAFIALAMLLVYVRRAASFWQAAVDWLRDILLWSVVAGLVCVIVWPALWVDPVGTVTTVLSDALRASGGAHQKGSFFLGQPVADPGAGFYPLVALFRTTPLIWMGVVLAIPCLWRRPDDDTDTTALYLALAYVILYTLLVTYGGKKQDRYLLPAFPMLGFIAAWGFATLLAFDKKRLRWLVLPIVAVQAFLVLPTFPYYLYYNPLMGGTRGAALTMQLGWGEGLNEAAAYLNGLPEGDSARVTAWYSTTFEPYFDGDAIYKIEEEKISRSAKPGLAADYVVLYINQVQRQLPSEGALAYLRQAEPLHTVTFDGQPYAWVYPAPGVPYIIGGEARLVGQAELLGFAWHDDTGQRVESVPSNGVGYLQLYWEWQGKAPADPIQVSLVDEMGITWGWGNRVATNDSNLESRCVDTFVPCREQGLIVVSEYALAVFPGTPPGTYHLHAWIDRPATGEVVGEFPLLPSDAPVTVRPAANPPTDLNIETPVEAAFEGLTLLGYDVSESAWQPGESRRLVLFWRGDGLTEESTARLQLVSADIPVDMAWERAIVPSYPPENWQPGETYRDVWSLDLPRYAPRGPYDLHLTVGDSAAVVGVVEVGGRERQFDMPDLPNPLNATLGESIRVRGYALDDSTPGTLTLTLVWQALDHPEVDYTVFVQVLDAAGQVIAQRDSQPQSGAAPTGSWAAGEFITDSYTLELPLASESAPPHELIVGMYRPDTGARLPIHGTAANALIVTTFSP